MVQLRLSINHGKELVKRFIKQLKNNKQVKQVDQNQDLQIVRLMRKKEMIFLMLTLRR